MAVVDARFAGGLIEVTTSTLPHDESRRMVEVILPSSVAMLDAAEALRLAVTLIEAAADTERPEPAEWP